MSTRLFIFYKNFIVIAAAVVLLQRAAMPVGDELEQVRRYTRSIEFDYIAWTADALLVKAGQSVTPLTQVLSDEEQSSLVVEELRLQKEILVSEAAIAKIYSDPTIQNPEIRAAGERQKLEQLQARMEILGPLSESILQQQVSDVVGDLGLTLGGQPVPDVLYHVTPLPYALIVSPRGEIRQDANISLVTDLSLEQMVELEKRVEADLDVSALVVPVGGIGVYPTMILRTTDIVYLTEVIAHEWTHNYLTLRPLGMNYDTTPALRTMNETTAALAGVEAGQLVLQKFYPGQVEPETPPVLPPRDRTPKTAAVVPDTFDYRAEMHTTRVKVDELLKDGKIKEAENYMEARRVVFWENGYQIRRLNQAYFAFHGAYADQPGGAAGSDPVGPAVRELRAQSPSLAAFINRISWMTSFEQLQKVVSAGR